MPPPLVEDVGFPVGPRGVQRDAEAHPARPQFSASLVAEVEDGPGPDDRALFGRHGIGSIRLFARDGGGAGENRQKQRGGAPTGPSPGAGPDAVTKAAEVFDEARRAQNGMSSSANPLPVSATAVVSSGA